MDAQQAVTKGRFARGARLFLRLALALILLATAAGKLLDVRGFAEILRGYQAFPGPLLLPLTLGVALFELLLALWLFSGRNLFGAALVSVALHATYALWSAVSVLRGLKLANCGCFGVFLSRPLGWSTVVEDLVLTGAALGLAALSRRRE